MTFTEISRLIKTYALVN